MNHLLQDFYKEMSSDYEKNNQDFKCTIQLNAEHPIYKGHFEQIPVTPGVCLTQIVKEILMSKFQKDLVMTSADNIKFLVMINPKETPGLTLHFAVKLNETKFDVSAVYSHNDITYVKFKGKFTSL